VSLDESVVTDGLILLEAPAMESLLYTVIAAREQGVRDYRIERVA